MYVCMYVCSSSCQEKIFANFTTYSHWQKLNFITTYIGKKHFHKNSLQCTGSWAWQKLLANTFTYTVLYEYYTRL
jgi:hypothetical protein